jgi:hypothetical protein
MQEKDTNEKEENNEEIFDDFNTKPNSTPRETISSIDRERLTLVPINHLPRQRFP